ncbi:MAG: hypothetical protein GY856_39655 [bacterium]|nr:hypothetical protein [bacterium]
MKRATTYRILAAIVLIHLICVPAALAVTSIVKPVYYVPTDKSYNVFDFHNIQCGLRNAQRWYSRELPNKNLAFENLRLYYGAYTSTQCLNNMGQCIEDTKNGTGIDPWDNDYTRNKLLIIGRGFLGWAGGAGDTAGRGYAVVGAESLIAQGECAGNWWCNEEMWNGTVIHELGETFDLDHSSDPDSIMNYHDNYKNRIFTSAEASQVESDPATRSKDPNWTKCESHYQCGTLRCGCNGGDTMYCLPHSGYPTYCSSRSIPNWEYCRSNSQCASSYCDPDSKGEMACLPHTGYVYCSIDIFTP